jgi:hypothetical protein
MNGIRDWLHRRQEDFTRATDNLVRTAEHVRDGVLKAAGESNLIDAAHDIAEAVAPIAPEVHVVIPPTLPALQTIARKPEVLTAAMSPKAAALPPPPLPSPPPAPKAPPPAAPDAFKGIGAYHLVETVPHSTRNLSAFNLAAPPYSLKAMLRETPTGGHEVAYYVATRRDQQGRSEWIVGPDAVEKFKADVNDYKHKGNITYFWGNPRKYEAEATRMTLHALNGDFGDALRSWAKTWALAGEDPHWREQALATTLMGLAGAARPPTPGTVGRPMLTAIAGEGQQLGPAMAPRLATVLDGTTGLPVAFAPQAALAQRPMLRLVVSNLAPVPAAAPVTELGPVLVPFGTAFAMASAGRNAAPTLQPNTAPDPAKKKEDETSEKCLEFVPGRHRSVGPLSEPHNFCADVIIPNRYPGSDYVVQPPGVEKGKWFDAVTYQPLTLGGKVTIGARTLYEVKTNDVSSNPTTAFPTLTFDVPRWANEMVRERQIANACGYDFVVVVSDAKLKTVLDNRLGKTIRVIHVPECHPSQEPVE